MRLDLIARGLFMSAVLLVVIGWWRTRPFRAPALSVAAPPVAGPPLDTVLPLPSTGRYELSVEFATTPGRARGLLDAAPFAEFTATVADQSYGSVDTMGVRSQGTRGSYGFFLGEIDGRRGETLRLGVRSLESLEARRSDAPTIVLRRHLHEFKAALVQEALMQLLAVFCAIFGLWAHLRARARRRLDAPTGTVPA